MADTKISGLTEDTAPTATDFIVTVDVSDTTMDAGGSDKKVQLGNLATVVGSVGSPIGWAGATYYGTTLTTASGSVTLTTGSTPFQHINPSGANRDVNLPSVSSGDLGLTFAIRNSATSGAFYLVLKNSGGTQVGGNIPWGATLVVQYDGSAWQVL